MKSFIFLFLFGFISITSAFAASESVVVDANDSEYLVFNLKTDDKIQFQINVDGGRNDDIVLKIRNPTGGSLGDGRIVEYYTDTITARESGNYIFEFDNGMSVISSKRVDFSYEIIKRPIPKVITNTAKDVIGGCLIATATYGTEMAPQVQLLREIRDNKLLQTESGISFMKTFNEFYYSFSPFIADYERENSHFKEIVKLVITPMITSLSILNYVDMDSEIDVLGYGIGLVLLNIGMYVGIPITLIVGIRKI